ncbi:MAG: uracil-DNA glycosylase family protein [Pyrinomonadaceae bacterium]
MPHKNEISQLIADVKEEILYLQELGVGEFDAEIPEGRVSSVDSAKPKVESVRTAARPTEIPKIEKEEKKKATGSRLAVLPSLSKRSKITPSIASGTQPFTPVQKDPAILTPKEEALLDTTPTLAETEDTIEIIRTDIGNCTRCPLFAGRTQVVHTTGNFQADLMFIGEAPGADEDAQGFPFVGRAGQLLTKIIESIGLKREEVAIGNINRCRPPGNRTPTIEEAHTCRPFLLREIAVIQPKVIVVLGNTALHNLLDTKVGITKVRGNFQDYFGVKVMPTFHPAYLLRDPNKKREVWDDMKKVREYLKTAK